MQITRVEPLLINRYLFVRVETDEGMVGLGESGAWGFLEASAAAIEKFGRYLVGQDPLRIEHHWQYMYRYSHFRGSAIMGAISAIDIALWDIAGKRFGVPVYAPHGGRTRDPSPATTYVGSTTSPRVPVTLTRAPDHLDLESFLVSEGMREKLAHLKSESSRREGQIGAAWTSSPES